jgi:putative endonuclease
MSTERKFHVYIMASRLWGTLYIGVTNDPFRRIFEHKEGLLRGFTKDYGVKTLVYFEPWATAPQAILREKRLKKWPRGWKITLIRTDNPDWKDLAAHWYPPTMTAQTEGQTIARAKIGSPGRATRAALMMTAIYLDSARAQ